MRTKKNIALINYGTGNIESIINSISKRKFTFEVFDEKNLDGNFDCIIFPGIGNYTRLITKLKIDANKEYLENHLQNNRRLLGICLGFQVMAECTHEFQKTHGLSLFPGDIIRMANQKYHIGWNQIKVEATSDLFLEFDENFFYFNHGYQYNPGSEGQNYCVATASVDKFHKIPAIVEKKKYSWFSISS